MINRCDYCHQPAKECLCYEAEPDDGIDADRLAEMYADADDAEAAEERDAAFVGPRGRV